MSPVWVNFSGTTFLVIGELRIELRYILCTSVQSNKSFITICALYSFNRENRLRFGHSSFVELTNLENTVSTGGEAENNCDFVEKVIKGRHEKFRTMISYHFTSFCMLRKNMNYQISCWDKRRQILQFWDH